MIRAEEIGPGIFEGVEHLRDQRGIGLVDGGHALAVRIKRQFGHPWEGQVQLVFPQPGAGGCDYQRAFGRVTNTREGTLFAFNRFQGGIVGECAARQAHRDGGGLAQQGLYGVFFAHRGAKTAQALLQIQVVTRHVQHGHRHAVLGQRAGLVGADYGDRAEGLYRWQFADQRAALKHALRP